METTNSGGGQQFKTQVQETGQVSLPTLIHSFVACDRIRVSHAPAIALKQIRLLETEGATHTHIHGWRGVGG